jgi:hypothetical protein
VAAAPATVDGVGGDEVFVDALEVKHGKVLVVGSVSRRCGRATCFTLF